MLDVIWQIVAAGFFARLDQNDAARMRYALLSESRERGQGREHRIAVVGAAAAVQLVAFEARDPRAITLGPADHLRLLVEMAVKQHGVGTLARHFDQDQRRAARQPYNFERRAGQSG